MKEAEPISAEELAELKLLLTRAKCKIMQMKGTAFYIEIIMKLKTYFTRSIPTAQVNSRMQMLINPDFFKDQCRNDGERAGLLAHEASHIAYDHLNRGELVKDRGMYNEAADYSINNHLVTAGISLPAGGLIDSMYSQKSTEEIYQTLASNPNRPKQPSAGIGNDIGCGDNEFGFPDPNAPTNSCQLQNAVRDLLNSAVTSAKQSAGSIPGEILAKLNDLNNPIIPFEIMLSRFVNGLSKEERSYQKPNWRFCPDFYLPSVTSGEKITSAVFAIDTSGSTSGEVFDQAVSDVANVFKSMDIEYIDILLFDTVIQDEVRVRSLADFKKKIAFKGGGGTTVNPVLERINFLKPNVCVVVSDGYFDRQLINVKTPVVWAIFENKKFTAPFGKVYQYELRNQK